MFVVNRWLLGNKLGKEYIMSIVWSARCLSTPLRWAFIWGTVCLLPEPVHSRISQWMSLLWRSVFRTLISLLLWTLHRTPSHSNSTCLSLRTAPSSTSLYTLPFRQLQAHRIHYLSATGNGLSPEVRVMQGSRSSLWTCCFRLSVPFSGWFREEGSILGLCFFGTSLFFQSPPPCSWCVLRWISEESCAFISETVVLWAHLEICEE